MGRRPRIFAPGLLYHVIVRGNHREKIFWTARDYNSYLERLCTYRIKHKVEIYAYCLMANHAHLLLESTGPPVARFMQGVQQSYTQYVNRKYEKVGHLFQGRYKAIVCEADEYLLELVRYIHLNPVRARIVPQPEEYEYSSHRIYLKGVVTEIVNPTSILEMLGGVTRYRRFVLDGISEGHNDEYYDQTDQRFLGAPEFVEEVKQSVHELQVTRNPTFSLAHGVELLAFAIDLDPTLLRTPGGNWKLSRARTVVWYVLTRRLGFRVKDVAEHFGRSPAVLSVLIARFADRTLYDPVAVQTVDRLMSCIARAEAPEMPIC